MAYVFCLKEMHVISKTGHSLLLANKLAPQYVPDEVLPELLTLGCVPCDEEGHVIVTGQPIAVQRLAADRDPLYSLSNRTVDVDVPTETVSEELKIDAAVQAVFDAKDMSLMDRKAGFPLVHAVSERAGFPVKRIQIIASCKRLGMI